MSCITQCDSREKEENDKRLEDTESSLLTVVTKLRHVDQRMTFIMQVVNLNYSISRNRFHATYMTQIHKF